MDDRKLQRINELARKSKAEGLTELERQGLVYAQRTAGRFVTEDTGTIQRLRRELADGKVRAFLEDMEALGFSREEILSLIRDPRDVSGGERHEA